MLTNGVRHHSGDGSLPRVSLVLPVKNEGAHLRACLERLLDQDYPSELVEILVVDGASTDDTADVVRALQREHPETTIHLLHNPASIVPTALNIGIRAARSDIVIRMDGHTVPADDYVSACVRALLSSGAANVGGYWTSQGTTPFGRAVAVATAHWLGMGNARYRAGGEAEDVDTVPFGAFRREVFEKVGLFDESMVRNQDYEMNVRIRAGGERIRFEPSIRFTYTPRGTVQGLWRQYFQYGWWRVETVRRHPRSLRLRQIVPPAFVAGLLGLALIAPFWGFAGGALALLSATYAITVGVASLAVGRGEAAPHMVALALLIIHLSYGLGFTLSVVTRGAFPYRARPPHVPRLPRHDRASP
jgi:succinoglycan biosynthesis protein ExoA